MYSKPHVSNANKSNSYYGSNVAIAPSEAISWATLDSVDDCHADEECARRCENPVLTVSHDLIVTHIKCIYLPGIPEILSIQRGQRYLFSLFIPHPIFAIIYTV